jgi:signal transduction histidine kinase
VNLLSNAVKYSRVGSKVHVSAEKDGDEILIAVKDRGVGISEDDLPLIFGDFYVGKPSSIGEHGSGLGLAITRRIIEAHGGKITVESGLGKGSTFMIRLPLIKSNEKKEPALSTGVSANS